MEISEDDDDGFEYKEIKEDEYINLHFFDGTASALIKKTNPH